MPSPAIQSASSYNGGGATTALVPFASSSVAGNTIAATVWSDNGTVTGLSDPVNGAYTQVDTVTNATSLRRVYLFVKFAAASLTSSQNVTATLSAASNAVITIVELPVATSVRVHSTATGTGTKPSTSLTSTVANDVCVGLYDGDGTVQNAGTVGTNALFIEAANITDVVTQDGKSSGGTVSFTGSTAATDWATVAAAFAASLPVTPLFPCRATGAAPAAPLPPAPRLVPGAATATGPAIATRVAPPTIAPSAPLPPLDEIAPGFGQATPIVSFVSAPTVAPKAIPPPLGVVSAGAGQPPGVARLVQASFAPGTSLPPTASATPGFGAPPGIAGASAASAAYPTVLPPTPQTAPGFGAPPGVAYVASASIGARAPALPPQQVLSSGAGTVVAPLPPIVAFGSLAFVPLLPPSPSIAPGFGQSAQAQFTGTAQAPTSFVVLLPPISRATPGANPAVAPLPPPTAVAAVAAYFSGLPPSAEVLAGFGLPPGVGGLVESQPFAAWLPPAPVLLRGFGSPPGLVPPIAAAAMSYPVMLLPMASVRAGFGSPPGVAASIQAAAQTMPGLPPSSFSLLPTVAAAIQILAQATAAPATLLPMAPELAPGATPLPSPPPIPIIIGAPNALVLLPPQPRLFTGFGQYVLPVNAVVVGPLPWSSFWPLPPQYALAGSALVQALAFLELASFAEPFVDFASSPTPFADLFSRPTASAVDVSSRIQA